MAVKNKAYNFTQEEVLGVYRKLQIDFSHAPKFDTFANMRNICLRGQKNPENPGLASKEQSGNRNDYLECIITGNFRGTGSASNCPMLSVSQKIVSSKV